VTRFQVAAVLGVHHSTVAKLEHDGLPVAERGKAGRPSKYALPAVVPWYIARELERVHTQAGRLDLDDERARLARMQAKRAELDVRQREGELIAVAEVATVWADLLGAVRSRLLALPSGSAMALASAARDGGPRAVEAGLRDRITGALRDLAAWRPPASPKVPG
jgi:phage terminase Nu1 subunit (DNA packaging protein)